MEARGPLAGVRVLDLSRLLPGPYATRLLVDMGAQVDKLEAPGPGDYLRDMPPHVQAGVGACFFELNHGKRSLCLDLKKPQGADLCRKLLAHYDVLIDSFRSGVMRNLGLDFESLRGTHTRLICASILGYPEDDSRARKAGHDLNFVARSGLLTEPTGTNMPTAQVADVGAALYAATAICGALYARERDGQGQHIRVAMSEAVRGFGVFGGSVGWHQSASDSKHGRVRSEAGLLEGAVAAYGLYETADGGRVALAALEPKFWALFAQEMGLAPNPRATLPGSHQIALIEETKKAIASRSTAFWADFSERVDCCLSVVGEDRERGPAAVMHGAQFANFGVDVGRTTDDASAEEAKKSGGDSNRRVVSPPGRLVGTTAPKHGEDTEAIVREALAEHFDESQFASWKAAGLFG